MNWIEERNIINLLKKRKQERRVTESDLRRMKAALLTYQGKNSTAYQQTYLLNTVEELLPLFIEEIRLLQKELQKQKRAAKTVAQIYDSMKNIRGTSEAEQTLAQAITKLTIGDVDNDSNEKKEQK